jgi:hypothetical protein
MDNEFYLSRQHQSTSNLRIGIKTMENKDITRIKLTQNITIFVVKTNKDINFYF